MELGCSALIQAKIGRGNTKMQPDSTITLSKKLMDMSNDYVEIANTYFDLSLKLHSEIYEENKNEYTKT